jgi:hypothetical protein
MHAAVRHVYIWLLEDVCAVRHVYIWLLEDGSCGVLLMRRRWGVGRCSTAAASMHRDDTYERGEDGCDLVMPDEELQAHTGSSLNNLATDWQQ